MKVGYARVSSKDQNLDTQVERLKAEGCEKLFVEKISGASDLESRDQLQAALGFVREGDTLVMLRLDRLTRGGILETMTLLQGLDDRKVSYKFLDNPNIDTTTTAGRLVTAVFAEVNHAYLLELKQKQAHGIKLAKQRGVYKGGTVRFDPETIKAKRAEGMKPGQIAATLGCDVRTVWRALNNGDAG